MSEFEFSIACMASSHALCEWCGCWCHDDERSDESDGDEMEFQHFFDIGGEGGEW